MKVFESFTYDKGHGLFMVDITLTACMLSSSIGVRTLALNFESAKRMFFSRPLQSLCYYVFSVTAVERDSDENRRSVDRRREGRVRDSSGGYRSRARGSSRYNDPYRDR